MKIDRALVLNVAEALGLPIERIQIETWSPGDGKSRYRLTTSLPNGGECDLTPYFVGKGEFERFLRGYLSTFYAAKNLKKQGGLG